MYAHSGQLVLMYACIKMCACTNTSSCPLGVLSLHAAEIQQPVADGLQTEKSVIFCV
jgi:hypothetical protein